MNTKSKLALSLGLLVVPLALMAKTPEKSYVESYRGRTDIPVPSAVVTPALDSRFAGQQVTLEFVVDATGKPTLFAPASPGVNAELVAALVEAVSPWKFSPALVDGLPVAKKVVLPVNIVDSSDKAAVVAMQ